MDWSLALVPFTVALALILIPGLLIAIAAGQKGFDALGLAPALSVVTIAVSAIIAPLLGLRWAVWIPLVFALLLAALVYAILVLGGRLGLSPSPRNGQQAPVSSWWSAGQGWAYGGWAIGGLLLLRNSTNAIGDPNWVSQTYDANFHLNAIRYIADHGNASSLFISSMTSGDGSATFYPAAWHGFASLVFELSGAGVPVVANTVSVLIAGFIWPLSLLYLVRQLFSLARPSFLAAGVISAAYISFPLLLLYFGVLYPNSLGISLLPVGVAIVAQVFGLGDQQRLRLGQGLILGVLVSLAIALAHPNMVMTLLMMTVPMLAFFAFRQLIRATRGEVTPVTVVAQILMSASLIWLVWILWGIVRPPQEAGGWEPSTVDTAGIGEALLNNSLGAGNLWVISLLGLVGAFCVFHTRRNLIWLVALWAYTAYFYIASRSMTWDDGRDWVVGVWYHDPFRIAAMLPVAAAPLAVLGTDYLIRRLIEATRPLFKKRAHLAMVAISALVLVPLTWATQGNHRMEDYVATTFWSYAPSPNSPLLTPDEYKVLYALDNYVPEGATIIVNPWTGASLAYAISGREVTAYHTSYEPTPENEVLIKDLDQATHNPAVCRAVKHENARYGLYFGGQEINQHISGKHTSEYKSLEYLNQLRARGNGAVEVLYQSGQATLYRINLCG